MNWVLTAGDLVTHYRVLSPLGSGGMGEVYLAEDVRLGRRLALKVLSPRLCDVREGRLDQGRDAFKDLRERYDRGAAGADDLALLAAALGESQLAVEWLTEACTQRAPFLGYVDVEPAMAPLRLDPGCRLILQSHGFGAGA